MAGFVIRKIIQLLSGGGHQLFDVELDLNPSPPAKPGMWNNDVED